MGKGLVGCGGCCLFLGVVLVVFAAGAGEWFVKTAARTLLKKTLMPGFAAMKDNAAECAAYKDAWSYDKFTDGKRRFDQKDFKDCIGASKHYYLYHVTNPDAVETGTAPIVEKRGPWVFKTEFRNYAMSHNEKDDSVSSISSSWQLIDDEETKKLCPKCATDKLCASWPNTATKDETPTECTKGTINHTSSNAEYNTITHANQGYLGLMNALDVYTPVGGVDEKFLQHKLGSATMGLLVGPESSLAGLTSTLSNAALTEMQFGAGTLAFQKLATTLTNGLSNFETKFRAKDAAALFFQMQTVIGVPDGTTSGIGANAFKKLFPNPYAGEDGKILGRWDVSLTSIVGFGFWLSEMGARILCSGSADTSNSKTLFGAMSMTFGRTERCSVAKMVYDYYTAVLTKANMGLSASAGNVIANQWARNSLFGSSFRGGNDYLSNATCPTGTYAAGGSSFSGEAALRDLGIAVAPEFSCFLGLANTEAAMGR